MEKDFKKYLIEKIDAVKKSKAEKSKFRKNETLSESFLRRQENEILYTSLGRSGWGCLFHAIAFFLPMGAVIYILKILIGIYPALSAIAGLTPLIIIGLSAVIAMQTLKIAGWAGTQIRILNWKRKSPFSFDLTEFLMNLKKMRKRGEFRMEIIFKSDLKDEEKGLISQLVNTVTEGRVKYKCADGRKILLQANLTGVSVSGGLRYSGPGQIFSNDRFADCFEEILIKILPDIHKLSEIDAIQTGIEGETISGNRKKLEEGLFENGANKGYY